MGRYPDSFWTLVVERAAQAPDQLVAVDDYGRSLTRAELRDRAGSVAAALAAEGIGPGTVVSWQLPTVLEALVLLAALSLLDAVQNPLVPILREREVGFITAQVHTELLIVPERWRGFAFGEMAAAVGATVGFRVLTVDLEAGFEPGVLHLPQGDATTLPPRVEPAPGTVRWLYYSSGTTADPKGARHTDLSVMHTATALLDSMQITADDVYPIAFPVSHIGGMTMLTMSLVSGQRLVLFDAFDPATTPARLATHRPTLIGMAQPMFRAFMDEQLRCGDERVYPAARAGMYGGGPMPAETHDQVLEVLGLHCVGSWGLTEFPMATAAAPEDDPLVLRTGVGHVAEGVSIRVVDAEGRDVPVGEEGELWLTGPQCFQGYVDPSLDADAFVDGWFRTGDLGRLDDDGNVFLTGRLKDIIIRNAENISALAVEDAVRSHPAVSEVTVIGLPDARTGERVCAVIVPEPGTTVDVPALAEHCIALGLAKQKIPEQVELVDELPRNPMGKVLKQALRDRILARG